MKIALLTLTGAMFLSNMAAQTVNFDNTIKINKGDSEQVILEKAAHIIPTANQLSALRNEYIAFIHMGPNTFTRKEWGDGKEDPKVFDLKNIDT
ncbi:MAG: alpha-L-fucosidase, partial [Tannerellaceae bacterium]